MRLIIFVKQSVVDNVNTLLGEVVGEGAQYTFTTPLLNGNNNIVAYGCSWDFDVTGHDYPAIEQALIEQLGMSTNETRVRTDLTGANLSQKNMLVIDADHVSLDSLLESAGLHLVTEE